MRPSTFLGDGGGGVLYSIPIFGGKKGFCPLTTSVPTARRTSWAFLAEKKHQVFSPAAAAANETLHALKPFLMLGK